MVENDILSEASFDDYENYHNSIVNCSTKLPDTDLKVIGVTKDTTSKFSKFLNSIGTGFMDFITSPAKMAVTGLVVAGCVVAGVMIIGGSDD